MTHSISATLSASGGMSESAREKFIEFGRLRDMLDNMRGTKFGIAVKGGKFAVVESSRAGRRTIHNRLTGWASYDECLSYMRTLSAGGEA